jgi:hypothetical protein
MISFRESWTTYEMIYIDEAGFNLAKTCRRGIKVIGKRATVDVHGQRGANITMCAVISSAGLVLQKCQIGPYNTECLILFLDDLHLQLVPEAEREQMGGNMRTFVIAWDNGLFHHSHAITNWFAAHPRIDACAPFEDFVSAWRWKVYDHQPHDPMSLLDTMDAGFRDISAEDCQGWIRHAKHFYPRCIARDNIRFYVDENRWPNAEDHID